MKPQGRAIGRTVLNSLLALLFLISGTLAQFSAAPVIAAPAEAPLAAPATCGSDAAGSCTVTMDARDFPSGKSTGKLQLHHQPRQHEAAERPAVVEHREQQPDRSDGDQDRPTVTLPDGRYLVSVRSLDHKMWGAYFTLPDDADDNGNAHRARRPDRAERRQSAAARQDPRLRVQRQRLDERRPGYRRGRAGRLPGRPRGADRQRGHRGLQQRPAVRRHLPDLRRPGTLGFVEINNLGPATYFIDVHPPVGQVQSMRPSNPDSRWYQTTTIDGGLSLMAPTEEGADGTGAPGEQLWEPPNVRTAYWFGFVCSPQPFATPGTGEIVGTARNWVEWAPYTIGTVNDPVENPVRRPLRRVDRPDRLRRPGRCSRQLRHPKRPGRRLQPGHLGRAAQLHHALQARPCGRRRDRRRERHRRRRQRRRRRLALVRLAGRVRLQGP